MAAMFTVANVKPWYRMVTAAPPVGAAVGSVTVPTVVPPGATVLGVNVNCIGARTVRIPDVDIPSYEAVNVYGPGWEAARVVTVNVPCVAPDAMLTVV